MHLPVDLDSLITLCGDQATPALIQPCRASTKSFFNAALTALRENKRRTSCQRLRFLHLRLEEMKLETAALSKKPLLSSGLMLPGCGMASSQILLLMSCIETTYATLPVASRNCCKHCHYPGVPRRGWRPYLLHLNNVGASDGRTLF